MQSLCNSLHMQILILYFQFLCAVGSEKQTPENRTVQEVIRTLFTPYLTKCISRNSTNEVATPTPAGGIPSAVMSCELCPPSY